MEQKIEINKDLKLISKIIESKDFLTPRRKGIKKEMLEGPGRKLWEFIEDYWDKYSGLPSLDTINELLSESNTSLWQVPEPLEFLCEEILDRESFENLKKFQFDVDRWMVEMRPDDVMSNIQSFIRKQNEKLSADLEIVDARDAIDSVMEAYTRAKDGIMGIKTPFQTMNEWTGGWNKGDLSFFVARGGVGKCHAPDTKILMFDGSIREIQHVKVGDQLMGPDSKPRNVLNLARGREEMFEVIPVKGDSWKCNRSHILSLKASCTIDKKFSAKQIYNLSVEDYLSLSGRQKENLRLWKTGVEFKEREIPYDPYWLGLWIGDGTTREPNITKIETETEIHEYAKYFCNQNGLRYVLHKPENRTSYISFVTENGKHNPMYNFIESNTFNGQKKIRSDYLVNSRDNRLRLLAGIIDTDGHLFHNTYEVSTKSDFLKDDILFLARSLGLAAYAKRKTASIKSINFTGEYWKISIFGDVAQIPCLVERKKSHPRRQKKNPLVNGFRLESLGEGEYCGVSIDGDSLYLLADFTVTHNTWSVTLCAHSALKQKKKVLYFSGEMSTTDSIYRHLAIDFKIPYGPFRRGRLDPLQMEKMNKARFEYDRERLFKVVDASGGASTSAIEAVIDQVRPDLVIVDAAYRIKASVKTKDRFENLAIATQELKSIAGRQKIPIVASTQLNREATKKKGEVGTEDLAMTDVLGWEASNIFSMYQDEDNKKMHRMKFHPVKIREMEKSGKGLVCRWDFQNMIFEEVSDFEVMAPKSQIDSF